MSDLPKDLNLYQTSKCNFTCGFCSRKVKGVKDIPDISPGLVENILLKFPITSCCIAGFGEPLMSEGIFDCVRILNKNKIIPSIITNGSLIVSRISEIKEVELLYINVSLNTADRNKHYSVTQTKTFDEVSLGIEMLVRMKKFPVSLSMVIFKDNYQEIPMFLEYAEFLKVGKVVLINSLPYSEGAIPNVITEDDIDIIQYIKKIKKGFTGNMRVGWPKYLKKILGLCNSPWISIGVDGNGNVTGCRRVHGPDEKNGNINDRNVWGNDYFKELRKSIIERGEFSWYCERCFGNVS